VPAFEMPLDELVQRRTGTRTPDDLREFWSGTLAEARSAAAEPKADPVETGLQLVRTWDVTFSGYGGDPIRAWYHLPAAAADPVPVVVHYQGYGGGRGLAHQVPWWTMAGHACLEVDTRGQGSGHTAGDTPDPVGSGPAHPGYMTRGILDPNTYYYRRVFTDAVLAVDAVKALPGADPARIAVSGGSQGGAMAIAVGGLRDDLTAVLSDVPFLSDFRHALEVATTKPYAELYQYLSVHRDHVEQVFGTLAYFDVSVLAALARNPALFSVALMDEICPPSTVYAAYNAYAGPKEITVYPFNDHEGGDVFHQPVQLRYLQARLAETS
jgi:cephalosporin-C deacetylase